MTAFREARPGYAGAVNGQKLEGIESELKQIETNVWHGYRAPDRLDQASCGLTAGWLGQTGLVLATSAGRRVRCLPPTLVVSSARLAAQRSG